MHAWSVDGWDQIAITVSRYIPTLTITTYTKDEFSDVIHALAMQEKTIALFRIPQENMFVWYFPEVQCVESELIEVVGSEMEPRSKVHLLHFLYETYGVSGTYAHKIFHELFSYLDATIGDIAQAYEQFFSQ